MYGWLRSVSWPLKIENMINYHFLGHAHKPTLRSILSITTWVWFGGTSLYSKLELDASHFSFDCEYSLAWLLQSIASVIMVNVCAYKNYKFGMFVMERVNTNLAQLRQSSDMKMHLSSGTLWILTIANTSNLLLVFFFNKSN